MTDLASRIAALTGPDRAIDAEVADVLSWWPKNFRKPGDVGKAKRFDMVRCDFCECPPFTASLDATLAEIRRRGWDVNLDDIGAIASCLVACPRSETLLASITRTDDNLALAALEALVRAVEAGK